MICIWSSWCHCHPIISYSSKIQIGLPFWCQLTQVVLEKRPLNGCSSSNSLTRYWFKDSGLPSVRNYLLDQESVRPMVNFSDLRQCFMFSSVLWLLDGRWKRHPACTDLLQLVHGQVTIIFVASVCLCRVFFSRLRCDLDQTRTHVTCPGLVVSPRI